MALNALLLAKCVPTAKAVLLRQTVKAGCATLEPLVASPAPVVYLSGCTVNNNHAVRSDQKICSTPGGIMVNSLPFGFAVGVGAHPSPDDANIL